MTFENRQKSGFYIVKFSKLQRLELAWVPQFFEKKISESGIHIYWKTLDSFLLIFKRIFETACSVNGIGFVKYKPI